ncbi:MAG TPA: TOBE domain-containing protein [Pseudolabrys sp.]|nr:TOBE domain-containing protein [Pseudolabrys sp.]
MLLVAFIALIPTMAHAETISLYAAGSLHRHRGGNVITASITNESADEMKLETGKPAYAIIKASNVMVGVD